MPEYPYVDLDLLRTYALKIDHWSRTMVDTMKYSVRCYTGILRCDMKWNCDKDVSSAGRFLRTACSVAWNIRREWYGLPLY